jgi:predicted AAA+ superfamily ATPase
MQFDLLAHSLLPHGFDQLVHSPFRGHRFENMVIMEAVKSFAGKGERAPCYFYRTASGLEIDLIVDHGDRLRAYEIKFSSTPTTEMTRSLIQFKTEYSVLHASLLTLCPKHLPLSKGVASEHWSKIDC